MIFSLMDCALELFTFADNYFRGFAILCVTLAFVCVQLDTGPEILDPRSQRSGSYKFGAVIVNV